MSKNRIIPVILSFLILSSILFSTQTAAEMVQSPITKDERIARLESGLLPVVAVKGTNARMKLEDRMRFYNIPGLSIAVINKGQIEWARGYGVKEAGGSDPVTQTTLFQAASISKPITAMATLNLIEKRKLGLEDEVNSKLVSWKIPESEYTKDTKVTIRNLLDHTSGLTNTIGSYAADEKNVPTLVDALEGKSRLKTRPVRVEFVPGSRFEYSGGGFSVLQLLLTDISGITYPDFMQKSVLKPLGMRNSYFQQPLQASLAPAAASGHQPDGKVHAGKWRSLPEMAAGGLWTTPTDLARFAIEIQRSVAGKSKKVLSKQTVSQMLTPRLRDWGLGIMVQGEGRSTHFSHNGWNRGYRSYFVAFTETGQGAVIMMNGDSRGVDLIWEIIRGIATEYEWPEYRVKERTLAPSDPAVFKDIVGRYEIEPRLAFTVSSENDRLFITGGPFGRNKIELLPESKDKYFVTSADVDFTFARSENGDVYSMVIRSDDPPRTARKVTP